MPRLMHQSHTLAGEFLGARCDRCRASPSSMDWVLPCPDRDVAATLKDDGSEDPLIIDYTLLDPEGR